MYRRPSYRISEQDKAYIVSIDIPGVEKSAINVSAENGTLSIRASRENLIPEGAKILRREYTNEGYQLDLKIGPQVDSQNISAYLENGVLTLRLEKAAEAQARRISVA